MQFDIRLPRRSALPRERWLRGGQPSHQSQGGVRVQPMHRRVRLCSGVLELLATIPRHWDGSSFGSGRGEDTHVAWTRPGRVKSYARKSRGNAAKGVSVDHLHLSVQ
ncbi:unnamed protein product, partial [Ectocarpus sp. 13 AM-2016]